MNKNCKNEKSTYHEAWKFELPLMTNLMQVSLCATSIAMRYIDEVCKRKCWIEGEGVA